MANQRLSDAEILAQIPAARAREERERKRGLRATGARYDRSTGRVVLELSSGFLFAFPVRTIPALRVMTDAQLASVKLDVSGGALRWEAVDVDLSVPGLLLSALGADEQRRQLASLAGQVTSKAKAKAARENGLKGGRPKVHLAGRAAKSSAKAAHRRRDTNLSSV